MASLPDRVGLARNISDDEWIHHFANGLVIHTEPLLKADTLRILPIGGPQSAVMNHLLCFPERVAGKRVFEPFAGSGAIGLMAVKAGARHVDLLDVNPRAADFQHRNAEASGIARDSFTTITADLGGWTPAAPYELLLANPPFVPTPAGMPGSLTSDGGPDGNHFAEMLLRQLNGLLHAEGEALIFLMQLVRDEVPLVLPRAAELLPQRPMRATPTQRRPIPFEIYHEAYCSTFPAHREAIDTWAAGLNDKHGSTLTVSHYVLHIQPEGAGGMAVTHDFAEKFGEFWTPSEDLRELAVARVLENLVPETSA